MDLFQNSNSSNSSNIPTFIQQSSIITKTKTSNISDSKRKRVKVSKLINKSCLGSPSLSRKNVDRLSDPEVT